MNKLQNLAQILKQKSQKLNLFSNADREKLESLHFPDSLMILDCWDLKSDDRILDIGTGGGVPGLVLATECPDNRFVLLDSTKKKLTALDEIIDELQITNVETLWGRVEELAHKERESFDIVTARAVAGLPTLLEYAAGFVKVGGSFYAWKPRDYEDELNSSKNAQETLNLKFESAFDYELPDGSKRSILRFKKTAGLDIKYPRRTGSPSKSPIL